MQNGKLTLRLGPEERIIMEKQKIYITLRDGVKWYLEVKNDKIMDPHQRIACATSRHINAVVVTMKI